METQPDQPQAPPTFLIYTVESHPQIRAPSWTNTPPRQTLHTTDTKEHFPATTSVE